MTKTEEIVELYKHHVAPCYAFTPIAMVKGRGTKVWDAEGKVYLDFTAGIAVQNVGHSHPRVVKAIQEQAELLTHVSNLYMNENQPRLAKKLAQLSMGGKCFFCNSGAEANEALFKLARLWGGESGRHEIVAMRNSFHGRTLATLSATGQAKVQDGFQPLVKGFKHADFNDLDSVKAACGEKTVAVIVEAVQGEGGVIPATAEFMRGLRAFCDEKNLLMLCDEVQCGMGRTGRWFGFQNYGVEPDAFSLAKALGGGFPIGAMVTSPKTADVLTTGKHASTFGGSPLACAAALAVIGVIEEEGLLEKADKTGEKFRQGLQAVKEKHAFILEVRGAGLMLGMALDRPAKPLIAKLVDAGLLCVAATEKVVRFVPPLNLKDAELEEALDIVSDACDELDEESGAKAAPAADAAQ